MFSQPDNSNYLLQSKEWKPLQDKSSSPTPPPGIFKIQENQVEQDYRFEEVRLKTFEKGWTKDYIDPKDLAEAGFYYLFVEDRVRCFECKIEIFNWERGDVPRIDHRRHSPRCRFVRDIPCGNVPIGVDSDSVPRPTPRGNDVCGLYEIGGNETYSEELSTLLLPRDTKLRSLGIEKPKMPVYPKYASLESRKDSFDKWPKPMPPTKLLAEAGFFFTGEDDQTLCFQCGGGLKDWELDDDPWQQHFKWFPKCLYLLMCKGQEYVNSKGQTMKILPTGETELTTLESSFEDINLENNRNLNISSNNGTEDSNSNLASSAVANKQDLHPKELSKPTDDARMCKICYNADVGIVFLPCKHIIGCVNCASVIQTCPVCRTPVAHVMQVILS